MYPKKTTYEERITLVMDSGVQFLDFAVTLDLRRMVPGEFARGGENQPLARLLFDERGNFFWHPARPGQTVRSEYDMGVDRSINLLQGVWLPVPFFRFSPPRSFDAGPSNWARARIIALPEPDLDGNTHRVTFAFDTSIFVHRTDTTYLAPTDEDVRAGATFDLAHRADEMGWFLDLHWVDGWLREVFSEQAAQPPFRMQPDDIADDCRALHHQAHYLNLLHVLGTALPVPQVRVASNRGNDLNRAIPVDLVLDVGNSRTCGILVEDHPQENDGLSKRYELELRDLTQPDQVYCDPFESRVEFAQASFGKEDWSNRSGRSDAFQWPTIARVGPEAGNLAARRRGTEGSTGLSSPKRYLWDGEPWQPGWRFNYAYVKSDIEPHATAAPVADLIDEIGMPLYSLPPDERMPVFHPRYSRAALMTFMLSEVLAQALMQMNSPAQRLRMSHSHVPRHLRTIILTVPPSMPKPEREIFARCIEHAIGLVWKAMRWHPGDDAPDFRDAAGRAAAWPHLPQIEITWDEATCGQVVYLFNETQTNFGGRPEELFAALRRPDHRDARALTIASIDIGGGTTDLVITDYRLDEGKGSNVYIIPVQRFRDGFKVAGDDILLDAIHQFILPALGAALRQAGVGHPDELLSRLIGSEPVSAQDGVLRQQLTLQVFAPLGLRLLKAYEHYDPLDAGALLAGTFGELLGAAQPTPEVLDHVAAAVRHKLGAGSARFDLLAVPLTVSLRKVHESFLAGRMNIVKPLTALCEVVQHYRCDVLLLTGRPSCLPGVQALFRKLAPLPPARILALHHYRTGGWYPFNKEGRIDDPKTTAAVGAMLCLLSRNLRLPNFYFRASAFKPYSTLKFLGMIDTNNLIKADNVYFHDIDLDSPDYELPDTTFEMRGALRLGFRQLPCARWAATPLYVLSIDDPKWRKRVAEEGLVLKVRLGIKPSRNPDEGSETFEFRGAESDHGSVSSRAISLRLNTLPDTGLGVTHYWLDSGSVFST